MSEQIPQKLRVIQDYEKLSIDLQEQIKLVYPEGYTDHLITFTNRQGEREVPYHSKHLIKYTWFE